ncbi:MAG: IS110 family transposase [Steroidobacteraceae bacterium]
MNIVRMGIDLSKNSFHVHAVDEAGHPVLQKLMNRAQLRQFLALTAPCVVASESCGSAFHWARYATQCGHRTRIIASQFVKPYVKTNKNDFNDAAAICEAASRPSMRFVPTKSIEQQDIQALHRVRTRRVAERTALGNQIRGLLLEYGIAIGLSLITLRKKVPEIIAREDNELTPRARAMFRELYEELVELEGKIAYVERKINQIFKASEPCQRLAQIMGVGPLTSTALVASVGDAQVFKNGRHMAAWIGLVPRQHSTGGKTRLLGISKRGDRYLRTLLIHGARSALRVMGPRSDRRSRWAIDIARRRGANIATVALANKTARIAWAILAHGENYRAA